jgi:phospholipase/lecithinase/hemolysin
VAGGSWQPTDLIVVDAGGNDAGALIGAYLGAASGPAGVAAYQTFLAQQLDPATIAALLPQTNGAALAAGAYMKKLADTYWLTIKTNTLDKGATHVAILNMPDVTLTPRFRGVLAQVSAANGGGATGDAVAAALKSAIQQWIQAFNAQLVADVNGDARVAVVPFYEDFTDEVANPTIYGIANVTTPVCSETGFPATCVDAQLDAAPPAGATAGWWKTYLFSNNFHPTPYGHHLLASSVARALARAGWL